MTFWAYMIQCGDRHFYVGHTNDLEKRMGEHLTGAFRGYTSTRHPLHLVWSQEFPSRYEAVEAERQIKGWSRAKKLALIRGDWAQISALARSRTEEGRASTSSAQTGLGGWIDGKFLHPHPARLPLAPFSLEAAVRHAPGRLGLRFRLTGPVHLIEVPAPAAPARRDNLWQHICFEAFLAIEGGYQEFNVSPSTEWAAYRFSGYREGMADLDIEAPKITVSCSRQALQLTTEFALPERPTRLGLSAVIEEKSGPKSYWALRHPPGDKPDFHHPDCFALELPPPPAP